MPDVHPSVTAPSPRSGGSANADDLRGGGNDTIEGGAVADSLTGGTGTDFLSYAGSTVGVSVSLGTGAVSGGDAAGDTISGFEGVPIGIRRPCATPEAGSRRASCRWIHPLR